LPPRASTIQHASPILLPQSSASVDEKQDLLETVDPLERLNRIGDILEIELEKLNVDRNINTRVKRQMERAQKSTTSTKAESYSEELGRGEKSEIDELKKKIDTAGMSKEVHEKAIQELKRLELMPPMSAESTVSRNYLDWLLAVPWKKRSKEIRDIKAAEKILNDEHYGLDKVKERILEFLAVRQLVKNPKGSILCFVGPPGVGKTSLAMSSVTPPGANSSAFHSAACAMRQKFAAIAVLISARSPVKSSR